MKIFFSLLLALALTPATAQAAARGEHLEPVETSRAESVRAYDKKISALLRTGFADKPAVGFMVIPAFAPEYAWALERRPDGAYLLTNSMAENVWYAKDNDVAVISREVALEPATADAVEELFRLAVAGARPPDGPTMGLDGVTYYVAVTGPGGAVRTGEVWSPPEDSPMGRLVDIGDGIFALGDGKGTSRAALVERIRALAAELRGR